jgi:hypothetical protein
VDKPSGTDQIPSNVKATFAESTWSVVTERSPKRLKRRASLVDGQSAAGRESETDEICQARFKGHDVTRCNAVNENLETEARSESSGVRWK